MKISIITGTRAEYGLLKNVLHEIQSQNSSYKLLCWNALSKNLAICEVIEEDGFLPKLIWFKGDSPRLLLSVSRIWGFQNLYKENKT